MKFGRAYTIYVQSEAQRLIPKCPYVEFKRFKKLLKRCPHLIAPSDDAADASGVAADTLAVKGGVTISEYDETQSIDTSTDLVVSENSSSVVVKTAHVSCPGKNRTQVQESNLLSDSCRVLSPFPLPCLTFGGLLIASVRAGGCLECFRTVLCTSCVPPSSYYARHVFSGPAKTGVARRKSERRNLFKVNKNEKMG